MTTAVKFPELDEVQGKLSAKQKELADIFAEAGPEIDTKKVKSLGDGVDVVAKIRELNTELTELGKKRDELVEVKQAAERLAALESGSEPDAPASNGQKEQKSIGDLFVESKAFKGWARGSSSGPTAQLDIELKALFDSATGWVPEATRGPRIVDFPTRPVQVTDLIPQTTTGQNAVTYMEETTFTNTAAETAEGVAKPEATLALTERTEPVRKIAVWLPVTDETLEDVPRVRGYVNNRLVFMVQQRLDGQILVGDGTAPNLSGILDRVGIQTQAKGADPTPDAVYKAMTKVEVTGQAQPNAAVFHPNDWQDIRLLRTADGIYIWGSPSEAGPERIWGLRVVKAIGLTENTGLVGDFANFTELAVRRGIDVQVSNSHASYFIENKQAIRAEMRAAFIVYRPSAFCTVTGI